MPPLDFLIVDVFAVGPFTGNQLAVFLDAGDLSTEQMQQLAREMNYSETTFVLSRSPREGGYDVRIFTPKRELPFAGHPTLGTAYAIARELIGTFPERLVLNLPIGPIGVTASSANSDAYDATGETIYWMRQAPPNLGPELDPAAIAAAIGLPPEAIDPDYPVEEVSTGLPCAIVPLRSLAWLKKARLNRERFAALAAMTQSQAILMFCRDTYHPENDLCARVFAPGAGVDEDPATGSANGCLAAYLVAHAYLGNTEEIDARVEQGYEIQRPSLLLLRARADGRAISVEVGGRVVPIACGTLIAEC
ncbi:phenazine biosynthesis protein PhzF family [Rubidibacter lacunae KORDI 51-2]|uniref:Phenazine biosynthesis protein PhzF family n=1 Tax=Rubidibacter lacunae KORDI 51-2 TaxID=582515 RepID=U5DR07_9CHRO|nr:PhzF family phenazine biosynthesis protein [Rubidibacter lacunae]ERN43054.1 phenazine biosynthesis protein PhzF family [Rubidibacter lacunae KORDI 51-2]